VRSLLSTLPLLSLPQASGYPLALLGRIMRGEIGGMTKEALLSEILRLPVEERIELLGDAWDATAASPEQVPMPEWHLRVLQERLVNAEPSYVPWEEVQARLKESR